MKPKRKVKLLMRSVVRFVCRGHYVSCLVVLLSVFTGFTILATCFLSSLFGASIIPSATGYISSKYSKNSTASFHGVKYSSWIYLKSLNPNRKSRKAILSSVLSQVQSEETVFRLKPVLIVSSGSASRREVEVYKDCFENKGYRVVVHSKRAISTGSFVNKEGISTATSEWSFILCMTPTDELCFDNDLLWSYTTKVNIIPSLRSFLHRKDSLCRTINVIRKSATAQGYKTFPLCFVFPEQSQQFRDVAEALAGSVQWIWKPIAASGKKSEGPHFLRPHSSLSRLSEAIFPVHLFKKTAVVQEAVPNVLTVQGHPISISVFVLITSLSPLRAYVHRQGLAYHRNDESKNFQKIPGGVWTLDQLWQYVARRNGTYNVQDVWDRIEQHLLEILTVTEALHLSSFSSTTNSSFRCPYCFHLLSFDIILNTFLEPVLLDVNGHPSMHKQDSLSDSVKKEIITDVVDLLSNSSDVAEDVVDALLQAGDNLGIIGHECHISHDICLTKEDLRYLLNSRKEYKAKGGFRQLYPSLSADKLSSLISELDHLVQRARFSWMSSQEAVKNDVGRHFTADLHFLLMMLENHYSKIGKTDPLERIRRDAVQGKKELTLNHSLSDVHSESKRDQLLYAYGNADCSNDPATLPYLSEVVVHPSVQLVPTFRPNITEYKAIVSYDQLVITVSARTMYCQAEARFDDRLGPTRPTNYTLGVGNNHLSIVVVDIRHSEPWVVSVYFFNVHRQDITHGEESFSLSRPHVVCSLKQTCQLRLYPSEFCGIDNEDLYPTWKSALRAEQKLPFCASGHAQGRWIFPCSSCQKQSECFWREARWQPYHCRYPDLQQIQLSKCFRDKKVLFVGDSTNRGMMFYLLQKLNGTLLEWDKTHDIKIYLSVNRNKTGVGFAYYPQFWQSTNKRPSLGATLRLLAQRMAPLDNSWKTLLVVGGVQWLSLQHLTALASTLKSLHLSNIKVFIKTYGSGFHQHAGISPKMIAKEQHKLPNLNENLIKKARELNYEVIDTFNLTTARYKDYMHGKCACHFHRVVLVPGVEKSSLPHYDVQGSINEVYSNILISRACSDFVTPN